MSNFNGSFSFGSGPILPFPVARAKPPPVCPQISGWTPISYLRFLAAGNTQANLQNAIAHGGGASSIPYEWHCIGQRYLFRCGLYAQDDWRLRPNITLSTVFASNQNNFGDHADVPRLGLAWGIGGLARIPKDSAPRRFWHVL